MKHQRHQRRQSLRIALLCLPVVLVASACGASSSRPHSTAPGGTSLGAGTTGGAGTGGPNPNATETPPPGDIPDNQAFVPYSPASHAYSIKVPEGWAMTQAGPATLFTDKFNSIRVEKLAAATAPTLASATANEVPAIKAVAHGFVPGTVTTVARTAGTAIKITYRADSAPNPVTGKVVVEAVERYEFWRNGAVVVLSFSAPVGSDNVDPWRKVTDSFGWHA
jgi:hypothetical protein